MGFQTSVKLQQAPATAGDRVTENPWSTYPAPEAGFVAGTDGVIVGRFVWPDPDDTTGRQLINSSVTAVKPLGLIAREEQGQITTYLAEAGYTVFGGSFITAYVKGDYAIVATVGAAARGQKAFAKLSDGTMQAGDAGATISGFIETDYTITVGCLVGELATISL